MDDLTRIVLLSGASIADDISTAIACTRYGIDKEKQWWRRDLMNRFGIWKSAPLQNLISQAAYYGIIGVTYALDALVKRRNPDVDMGGAKIAWVMTTCTASYAVFNNAVGLIYMYLKKEPKAISPSNEQISNTESRTTGRR